MVPLITEASIRRQSPARSSVRVSSRRSYSRESASRTEAATASVLSALYVTSSQFSGVAALSQTETKRSRSASLRRKKDS